MKRLRHTLIGIGMATALAALVARASSAEVTGTGTAKQEGEAGKAAALRAALKDACEKACPEFLGPQRESPRYEEIFALVLADHRPYVSQLKTDSATFEEDTWKVTVSADVSRQDFEAAWKTNYFEATTPRLMVTVAEQRDGKKQETSIVEAGIEKYFLAKRFRLVDKKQFDEIKQARIKEAALSDDLAAVASIARDVGADLLVVGGAQADKGQEGEISGVKFQTYTSQASLKVVQGDSATLIASVRANATARSQDPNVAATNALEQLAGQIAAKAWKGCLDNWDKVVPSTFQCEFRVTGVTAKGVLGLEAELKKVEGVASVKLRDYRENNAQYDIVTRHNPKQFFTVLVGDKNLAKLLEVTGITNRVITARWKQEEI